MINTVVFDVGETLVDETRHWGEWADWLSIPRLTFFAALGAVIERGEHHSQVFELVSPGLNVAVERRQREACGWRYRFEPGDFYPDALPCLRQLRAAGYRIGLAGNQPKVAEKALAAAGAPADFIASSEGWGVEKPSPKFFARVAEAAGAPPVQIAYVGDRMDNDVLPAQATGMVAVFIRRGPWGYLHAKRPEARRADIRLDSLSELGPALNRWSAVSNAD